MISIIIVNYHSALLTKRAVESVISEGEDIEIFVVDNTATDAERLALGTLLYPNVKLIFNETNEGFAKACNTAYALSRGEFIFLLNPDAYVLPNTLRYLRDFLFAHPHAGAVGPKIYWDKERKFLLPPSVYPSPVHEFLTQLSRLSGFCKALQTLTYRRNALRVWRGTLPVRQDALSGGHILLRRHAIDLSGGLFDEHFFMYFEDSDLCRRLRKAGYGLYVEPHAEVIHSYLHDRSKTELLERSRALYFRKYFGKNFFMNLANRLFVVRSGNCEQSNFVDLGSVRDPIHFSVPKILNRQWLFEWSPSPLLIPSVGCFGRGSDVTFTHQMWNLLDQGTYYARVSDPALFLTSCTSWRWHKVL